jgi:hypothetical protein
MPVEPTLPDVSEYIIPGVTIEFGEAGGLCELREFGTQDRTWQALSAPPPCRLHN